MEGMYFYQNQMKVDYESKLFEICKENEVNKKLLLKQENSIKKMKTEYESEIKKSVS